MKSSSVAIMEHKQTEGESGDKGENDALKVLGVSNLNVSSGQPIDESDLEYSRGLNREGSFKLKKSGSFSNRRLSRDNSFSKTPRRRGSQEIASLNDDSITRAITEANNAVLLEEKEKGLLLSTAANRRRFSGRSIESITKNPRKHGGEAAAARGPSIITNHIVLGGRDDSNDAEVLKKIGITHILNVASSSLPNCFEDKYVYMSIPLHDTEDEDVPEVMPKAIAFIRHAEKIKGRVLIHCISGVSRSVTVCILYLVMQHKVALKDAYDYVYSCRPFIAPNDGFKLQMAEMERKCLNFSSVCGSNAGKHWDFYEWNNIKQTIFQKQGSADPHRTKDGDIVAKIVECCVIC